MKTHIVRFHNIFGPLGTYDGGREKAPAALCRKLALAKDGDEVEVWGDGSLRVCVGETVTTRNYERS